MVWLSRYKEDLKMFDFLKSIYNMIALKSIGKVTRIKRCFRYILKWNKTMMYVYIFYFFSV